MAAPNIPEAQRRTKSLLETPIKDLCGLECATFLCTSDYMQTRQLSERDLASYAEHPEDMTAGGSNHNTLQPVTLDPETATVTDGLMQVFRRNEELLFANAAQIQAFSDIYPETYLAEVGQFPDRHRFARLLTAMDALARNEPLKAPDQIANGIERLKSIVANSDQTEAQLGHDRTQHTETSRTWLEAARQTRTFLTPVISELQQISEALGKGRGGTGSPTP